MSTTAQPRLFVLGDSISIHYGPYLKQMLAGVFHYDRKRDDEALNDLDQPVGANGGDSQQVLAFLLEQPEAWQEANVILLNCGLHDLRRDLVTHELQLPPEIYQANLRNIVSLIKQHGVDVIWVRTTPVDEKRHNSRAVGFLRFSQDVEHYNAIADQVMQDTEVTIVDLYTFTQNLGTDLYCDHAHFREEIRALQAAFIAGHLTGYLRGRS